MDIPISLIPIEPDGFHIMMNASINGFKANVLIDTGASKTIMDLSRAKEYLKNPKIRPYDKKTVGMGAGRIQTWVCDLPEISIGGKRLNDLQIVLIDLKTINEYYAMYDLPRIDIVLGGDLLMQFGAVIDYREKLLKIR